MQRKYILYFIASTCLCLTKAWVKDVDSLYISTPPPAVVEEKGASPFDIYQLILWSLNKFRTYSKENVYTQNGPTLEEDAPKDNLPKDFQRLRRMKMFRRGMIDPVASGLIGKKK